jgi:threonine synthase
LRYISTRQTDGRTVSFEHALLQGLARDGGLYIPAQWPHLSADDLRALRGRPYPEVTAALLARFTGRSISRATLGRIAAESYATFDHPATAPLVQLGPDRWLLELFHGPTLAFKDFALQVLARLLDSTLAKRGRKVTIVGATSGDTGSAAIEACRDRENLSVVILHPAGRVSEIQRRQMTTVDAENVHNVAIAGTFDDCQALVKGLFADLAFRDEVGLAAVNSINWARVAAQTAYYVYAALALGAPERAVSFIVPTGNFGNVYAGYVARKMGLPVERLVVATNSNDILARFLVAGRYEMSAVERTLSPSMDIQVASNFERYLADLCDRDGAAVIELMDQLRARGSFSVSKKKLAEARVVFAGHRSDDDACLDTIAEIWHGCGRLIDPHSAAAVHAANAEDEASGPVIALATAHAAKFPDAVERATGVRPALPPRLADLMQNPERCAELPNDLAQVKHFVRACVGASAQERVA